MTEYSGLVLLAAASWTAYAIEVVVLGLYYHMYLTSRHAMASAFAKTVLLLFSLAGFTATLYTAAMLTMNPLILVAATAVLTGAYISRRLGVKPCREIVEKMVEGYRILVCKEGKPNAYTVDGKIVVGEMLLKHLEPDELEALIQHEKAHNKTLLETTATLTSILWLYVIAAILAAVYATTLTGTLEQTIYTMTILYPQAATATLAATILSWITEHEADRKAAENTGPKPLAKLLIKTHILLETHRQGTINLIQKLHLETNTPKQCKTTPLQAILTLLAASLNHPKWITEYTRNPQHPTHPPPIQRITHITCTTQTKNTTKQTNHTLNSFP